MTTSRQTRISALPAELQEKLQRRLAGQAPPAAGIPPADRSAPLPLSFPQQRLWFIDQFEPGQANYNSALALRLTGPLDTPALARALRELTARHESLRTTFDNIDGTGVQVIHPPADITAGPADSTAPLAEITHDGNPGGLDQLLAAACA